MFDHIMDLHIPYHEDHRGNLLALAVDDLPFTVKRVYWVWGGHGQRIIRGGHAHRKTSQVFFCLSGESEWTLQMPDGQEYSYHLTRPNQALLVKPMVWHYFTVSEGTVILAFASDLYDEADYIREYTQWQEKRFMSQAPATTTTM